MNGTAGPWPPRTVSGSAASARKLASANASADTVSAERAALRTAFPVIGVKFAACAPTGSLAGRGIKVKLQRAFTLNPQFGCLTQSFMRDSTAEHEEHQSVRVRFPSGGRWSR
jgi:hypothetical protein